MRFNPFVPHGPEPFTPTPKSGGPVLSTVEFFKKKIDELFRRDSMSVHYTPEDKTDEEKAVARDNVGAQEKLVSGVNLKTVRGQSLLGSGDVPQVPAEWGGITGNLGMQTDLTEALGGKADRSDVYTKSETDEKITANVENSVTSTSTTKALSAKMGRELQDQIQNLKHSKADEVKPSFSTITINGVDYTEWILGTRSGKIMLSVDMGGISTEIAAFNPVTGVFESAPSQYRDTLRFDREAPVVGASPTLFDHVARESALSGKANISHTHTKSEITDFPTSMPPTAHSHASDNWFTTAIEDVKLWAKSLLPDWLTPSREEPPTQDFVLSVEYKANNARDAAQLAENKAEDALAHADDALTGLEDKLDLTSTYEIWDQAKTYSRSAVVAHKGKIWRFRDDASVATTKTEPTAGSDIWVEYPIRDALRRKINNTSIAPAFIANHLYKAGDRIVNDGTLYKAKADFTSGAAFRSADWDTDNVVNAFSGKLDADGGTAGDITVAGRLFIGGNQFALDSQGHDLDWFVNNITSGYMWDWSSIYGTPKTVDGYGIEDAAKTSDIPSLSGKTFDLSTDAQFKNMCIAMARALGAIVTHTTDDTSTGSQVAQAYGITPTDATTFGELQNKAGLGDSAVLGDL